MRLASFATATLLGIALPLVILLSMKTLGPRWENHPTPGPLLAAFLITATYWLVVAALRRHTRLMPGSAKYAMLAATCLTWAAVYVSVKGFDDPPVFAFLGLVIWLPALLIYRLPENLSS